MFQDSNHIKPGSINQSNSDRKNKSTGLSKVIMIDSSSGTSFALYTLILIMLGGIVQLHGFGTSPSINGFPFKSFAEVTLNEYVIDELKGSCVPVTTLLLTVHVHVQLPGSGKIA
jgi:hypothetical protein